MDEVQEDMASGMIITLPCGALPYIDDAFTQPSSPPPTKRRRGRPRLTEEEKQRRLEIRLAEKKTKGGKAKQVDDGLRNNIPEGRMNKDVAAATPAPTSNDIPPSPKKAKSKPKDDKNIGREDDQETLALPNQITNTRIQHYARIACLLDLAKHKVDLYARNMTNPRAHIKHVMDILSHTVKMKIPLVKEEKTTISANNHHRKKEHLSSSSMVPVPIEACPTIGQVLCHCRRANAHKKRLVSNVFNEDEEREEDAEKFHD